jgi:hypothetical protein
MSTFPRDGRLDRRPEARNRCAPFVRGHVFGARAPAFGGRNAMFRLPNGIFRHWGVYGLKIARDSVLLGNADLSDVRPCSDVDWPDEERERLPKAPEPTILCLGRMPDDPDGALTLDRLLDRVIGCWPAALGHAPRQVARRFVIGLDGTPPGIRLPALLDLPGLDLLGSAAKD